MSVSTSGTQAILTSENLGWNGAMQQLPAAPAGTKAMVFTFRAWFDTIASNDEFTTPGWEPTWLLGFCFNDTWPTRAARNNFWGYSEDTNSGSIVANNHQSGSPPALAWYRNPSGTLAGWYNGRASSTTLATSATNIGLAPNPTAGATRTDVWIAKVEEPSAAGMRFSRGYNLESLAPAAFPETRIRPATVWTNTNIGFPDPDPGSNWRPGGGIAFPRWLMLRFPSPTIGRKMHMEHFTVEYFDYAVEQ